MNAFPKSRTRVRGWTKGRLGFMAVLLVSAGAATGQTTEGPVTPNFRDADFTELVEAVSAATGKSFIIDPRVHARVTMLSSTEMSSAAFYDAFLSVLPLCGLVARTDGNFVTILPDPKAVGFIRVSLPYVSSCSPVARWAE
jgi:type II secretory pathway component GspD/PulD (secretin)